MASKYPQLFKQLYQRKFYQDQNPKTSLERVRIFQKKIHDFQTTKNKNKSISHKCSNSDLSLMDVDGQQPRNFVREMMKGHKKHTTTSHGMRKSLWGNEEQNFYPSSQIKRMSVTAGTKHRNPSPDTMVEPGRKYSIKKFVKMNQKSSENSSKKQKKRIKTPSKNVIIGGRNLEVEAQLTRKQFCIKQKEIDRYQKEISTKDNSSAINKRRRTIRYERRSPFSKIKIINEDKDEGNDLRPWAVFGHDHQYY